MTTMLVLVDDDNDDYVYDYNDDDDDNEVPVLLFQRLWQEHAFVSFRYWADWKEQRVDDEWLSKANLWRRSIYWRYFDAHRGNSLSLCEFQCDFTWCRNVLH